MLSLIIFSAGLLLVSSQQVNHVAFSAGLTHDENFVHNETVKYDKVWSNVGSGYSSSTGVFTAPIAGLYVFQFHTLAHQDKSTWLELYHNDNYVASVYGHTSLDYASAGNSVVLRLNKGDLVQIEAVDPSYGSNTNIYGQPDEIYSTFSGYLIAPSFSEVAPVGK